MSKDKIIEEYNNYMLQSQKRIEYYNECIKFINLVEKYMAYLFFSTIISFGIYISGLLYYISLIYISTFIISFNIFLIIVLILYFNKYYSKHINDYKILYTYCFYNILMLISFITILFI